MAIGIVLVLAVIQGLTEFIPVSSSGHLVLAQALFGLEDPGQNLRVVVALHVGSLLAILAYFFRDFLKLFGERRREMSLLCLASIPAGIVGFLFQEKIEGLFGSARLVCLLLVANGVFLWIAEQFAQARGESTSWWKALVVGLAQVAGMAPGISRSGSTIGAALLLGARPRDAVRFSFFLGAIAIFGAGLLQAKKAMAGEGEWIGLPILLGVIVSFAVSLAAIRIVTVLADRRGLRGFAAYCVGVGIVLFPLV